MLRWGIGFVCVLPAALFVEGAMAGARATGRRSLLSASASSACSSSSTISRSPYTTAARASLALATLPLSTMVVGALLGVETLTMSQDARRLHRRAGVCRRAGRGPVGRARRRVARRTDHAGAVLCMAFYNVWSRPFMQRSSALGFLTVGMGAGAAALIMVGLFTGSIAALSQLQHAAMDRRHLSRRRRRRAGLHPLGAGAGAGDADARRQHHDRQPDRGRLARDPARRRADHAQPCARPDRGVRRDLDRDVGDQEGVRSALRRGGRRRVRRCRSASGSRCPPGTRGPIPGSGRAHRPHRLAAAWSPIARARGGRARRAVVVHGPVVRELGREGKAILPALRRAISRAAAAAPPARQG